MGLVGGLGSVGAGGSSTALAVGKEGGLGFTGGSGGNLASVGVVGSVAVRGFTGGWGLGFLGGGGLEPLGCSAAFRIVSSLECLLAGTGFGGGEGLVGTRAAVESCSFGGFFGGIGLGAFFVFGATVPSLSVIVSIGSNGFSTSLSSRRLGALVDLVFGLRGTEGLCPRLAAVAGEGTGEGAGEMEGEGVLGGVSY